MISDNGGSIEKGLYPGSNIDNEGGKNSLGIAKHILPVVQFHP